MAKTKNPKLTIGIFLFELFNFKKVGTQFNLFNPFIIWIFFII